MSTISVDVSSARIPVLQVGYQGENEVTDVLFDISSWITEYGEGTVQLRVKRPQNSEDQSYLLSLPISSGVATWTVSELDTANKGNGKAQINYLVGTAIKDSVIYPYKVGKSIIGSDSPVDPFYTWVERAKAWAIGKLLDDEDVPASDETYNNNAKHFAERIKAWAIGKLADGTDVPTTDETYHNNSKYFADQSAEQSALARQYASQFVGAPRAASTAEAMSDHDLIYVYTGTSTSSLTNGHWYYYDGDDWEDGGVYNSTAFYTDNTLSVSGAAADSKAAGDIIAGLTDTITRKMIKIMSNNYADSDFMTAGYVIQTGNTYTSSSYMYSKRIPVSSGDVVRRYSYASGAFEIKALRYVCAYDASGSPVSASGAESVYSYTVPVGITSVVITVYGQPETTVQNMITVNYEATEYEPYFEPYYISSDDFIENALSNYSIPEHTVDGYNLLKSADDGAGYYYGTSIGSAIHFGSSSSYHYAVMAVEKNTDYLFGRAARFWAFTDDSDIVTSFGETSNRVVNSGNGTKLYYSIESSVWNEENTYGSSYALVVCKGMFGSYKGLEKPSFIKGLTQNTMEAKYACALPKKKPQFTVNINQDWYEKNIIALEHDYIHVNVGSSGKWMNGKIMITPTSAATPTNGYWYCVYDEHLACIAQQSQLGMDIRSDNLSSCSALVIGDSTVAQASMTQTMLNAFSERNKTLTLLGSLGTSLNKHEGRSGWSAKDYCTEASKGGVTNPFYNTSESKFDFSYYMTNQGYSSVDFVIIQLGINDLYGRSLETSQNAIETTAGYIEEIINSIQAYNSSQKTLLNLPTAPNSDQSKHTLWLPAVKNIYIRYNEYIQYKLIEKPVSKIRFSHCHLILDPDNDISDDVHPKQTGYEKMGMEVVSQINCWQNS